jgi:hypothetical protein
VSNSVILYWRRWRLALVENCSSSAQIVPDCFCSRVRATEHAPCDPFHILERRHGLVEIVERGAVVFVERLMYDQRRPERVRFKCRGRFGTRRYVLRCDEATDAVLLVGALRALTNPKPGPPSRRLARSKSGAIVDESRAGVHDDLMRVPGKPLGFLAASTIEYHPARPEAHRSTVLAGQKLHSSRPPKPRELPVKVSLRHK